MALKIEDIGTIIGYDYYGGEVGIIINNTNKEYKILALDNPNLKKDEIQIRTYKIPFDSYFNVTIEQFSQNDFNFLIEKINLFINNINNSSIDFDILVNLQKIKSNYKQILDSISKKKKNNSISNNNYGNIKSLIIFENIYDFFDKIENLYNVKNWNILSDGYESRAEKLSNRYFFNFLIETFNSKNLTNKSVTNSQVISFLDTLSIMHKVFNLIDDESILKEMKIIMEYVIPELSKPRIDYILTFRNSMILIEFSKASSMDNLSNETTKKTQQLIGYVDMLKSNITNKNINIIPHVCMYFDNSNEKNVEMTNNTIRNLHKKIYKIFKSDELKNAFEILTELE